jgi:hypothetical protein
MCCCPLPSCPRRRDCDRPGAVCGCRRGWSPGDRGRVGSTAWHCARLAARVWASWLCGIGASGLLSGPSTRPARLLERGHGSQRSSGRDAAPAIRMISAGTRLAGAHADATASLGPEQFADRFGHSPLRRAVSRSTPNAQLRFELSAANRFGRLDLSSFGRPSLSPRRRLHPFIVNAW